MSALPQSKYQIWKKSIEPTAAIAKQSDAAGRQRQRFTARDWGGESKRSSESDVKPARAKQALLAMLLESTSATASAEGPQRCSIA